jgi:hypothetical protein
VIVDYHGEGLRLLLRQEGGRKALTQIYEEFDLAWSAFKHVFNPPAPVLAEVTTKSTAPAPSDNSTSFLLGQCMRIRKEAHSSLRRGVYGAGIRLTGFVEVAFDPAQGGENPPLRHGDFNVLVETLLEDPRFLYFQVTAKWPRAQIQGPAGVSVINPDAERPSHYVTQVDEFLKTNLVGFLSEAARND